METIINLILIISGSAVGSFIFRILEKLFDEFLANKRAKSSDKKQLTVEVIKICAEASKAGFNVQPRNYEHCVYITERVRHLDDRIGEVMGNMVSAWKFNGFLQSSEANEQITMGMTTKQLLPLCQKLQAVAKNNHDKLIKAIKKWG